MNIADSSSNYISIHWSGNSCSFNKRPLITRLHFWEDKIFDHDASHASPERTTLCKFFLITATSVLVSIVHLVRSVAFVQYRQTDRAKKALFGALAYPFVAAFCFTGAFFAYILTFFTGKDSLYREVRMFWARFEATINTIDLKDPNLRSYSKRVNKSWLDVIPASEEKAKEHCWIAAPCMQPLLEGQKDLLNQTRMKKIFPLKPIEKITQETSANGNLKIILHGKDVGTYEKYVGCNGALSREYSERTCCYCWKITGATNRFLCLSCAEAECTFLPWQTSCKVSTLYAAGLLCLGCSVECTPNYDEDQEEQNRFTLSHLGPTAGCCLVRPSKPIVC